MTIDDSGKGTGIPLHWSACPMDGATWDLGYPRMVVNGQGELVWIYYYTTDERYEQHVEVSLVDPADL